MKKVIFCFFFLSLLSVHDMYGQKFIQDAIDVVRGKKNPVKIVKKWYEELEDEVSQAVGMTLEASGDLLEFVGEEGNKLVSFSEDITRDLIKLNKEAIEFGPDVVDVILPDGPWRVDIGIVEVKSHKSIDDRLRDYNNEFAEELNNGVTISRDILSAAASGVEYTGTLTKYLGKYLAASSQGFPELYSNPMLSISKVDRSIAISDYYLNRIVEGVTKKPFKYGEGDKEYLQINQLTFQYLENLNSIKLVVIDGIVGWDADAVRGAIKIKNAEIQLIPEVKEVDGVFYLGVGARMVNLNLKDFPPKFDEMMAWAIQDLLFKEPIFYEDLSSLTNLYDKTIIQGKRISNSEFQKQERIIDIQASKVIARIQGDKMLIQIANKEMNLSNGAKIVSTVSSGTQTKGLSKRIREKLGLKFPAPPIYNKPSFEGADFRLLVSHSTLNAYLSSLIGNGLTFPLSDDLDKSLSNDYVKINPLSAYEITDRSTIRLKVNGSVHFKKLFAKINLTIEEIEIELVPEIIQIEDKFYFSMKSAVTSLKINDFAPDFERALANLVITKSLNKAPEDITSDILFDIPNPLGDESNLNPGFQKAGFVVNDDNIELIAKVK